eukprot:RCo033673
MAHLLLNFFGHTEVRSASLLELCAMLEDDQLVEQYWSDLGPEGGVELLLRCLKAREAPQDTVASGLRALWRLLLGHGEYMVWFSQLGGKEVVAKSLRGFGSSEAVAEYCLVILYNVLSRMTEVDVADEFVKVDAIVREILRHTTSDVVLKFGYGLCAMLCHRDGQNISLFTAAGGAQALLRGFESHTSNEMVVENAVRLLSICSKEGEFRRAPQIQALVPAVVRAVSPFLSSNVNVAHFVNSALWNLGLEPTIRAAFAENGGLDCLSRSIYAACRPPVWIPT